jgi:hypothetical protein
MPLGLFQSQLPLIVVTILVLSCTALTLHSIAGTVLLMHWSVEFFTQSAVPMTHWIHPNMFLLEKSSFCTVC